MFNTQLKLRGRILLGYGVPLLLTFISTSAVVFNAKKVEQQSQYVDRGWLLVRETDRLELLLHKRQAMARTYFLTKEQRFWDEYEESVSEYNKLMESTEQLVSFSTLEQAERLKAIQALMRDVYQANLEVRGLIQAGKFNTAIE